MRKFAFFLVFSVVATILFAILIYLGHRNEVKAQISTAPLPKAEFLVTDRTDLFYPDSGLVASAGPVNLEITEEDIKEMIINKAREYGIVTDLALDLAEIESQLNPTAKNPNSTAKGIYQWLDGSWESFCDGNVLNYRDNIDCTMKVLGKDIKNIKHWTVDANTKEKLAERGWVF